MYIYRRLEWTTWYLNILKIPFRERFLEPLSRVKFVSKLWSLFQSYTIYSTNKMKQNWSSGKDYWSCIYLHNFRYSIPVINWFSNPNILKIAQQLRNSTLFFNHKGMWKNLKRLSYSINISLTVQEFIF
jgi:hypothetical protein